MVHVESVETRLMMSAAAIKAIKHHAHMPTTWKAAPAISAPAVRKAVKPSFGPGGTAAVGYGPTTLRAAYGLGAYGSGNIHFNGVEGTGAGQTIAIVDAYDDPNAAGDLHQFDLAFGLPDAPSFTKLSQNGDSNLPGTDPSTSLGNTWELEESLDIEWAHAMAPLAKIILFEAVDNGGDGLYTAVQTAAAYPGVSVVSMSWGGDEYSDETYDDAGFTSPAGKGVTFLASTGDVGATREYPAMSPNVLAIGGTTLHTTGGAYSYESGWGGGGGNTSTYEPRPSYQVGTTDSASTTLRAVPDVSMDADPHSGVAVYDTYDFGTDKPWSAYLIGGTSLACPMWAGLIAVTNQGRAADGLQTLNYSSTAGGNPFQTQTRLYQLRASDYNDVTTGGNGFSAVAGYDLATGLGTPVANVLVPDLVGVPTVTARVFIDNNRDGIYESTDTPVANQTVFLDLNGNSVRDALEPSAVTSTTGLVTFADVVGGGTVALAPATPAGYVAAAPSGTAITAGATATAAAFSYLSPTVAYTSTATNAVYTLKLDPGGATERVLLNGATIDSFPLSTAPAITFNAAGSHQTVVVDGTNGNPIPTAGLTVNGSSRTTLSILGTAGNDAYTVASAVVAFGSKTIGYSSVSDLMLTPSAGTDSLNLSGGSLTLPAPTTGLGIATTAWSNLSVAAGSTLTFGTAARHGDRYLVVTAGFTDAGTIDLGGNDLVIQNSATSAVNGLAAAGFNGGLWTGTGLRSSAAAADPNHLTALGVAPGSVFVSGRTIDGYAPSANDVVVKFTYYGDANLDGKVDGSDYTAIDFAAASGATGFAAGDFDYSGSVDGSDYSLIDNAYHMQSTAL